MEAAPSRGPDAVTMVEARPAWRGGVGWALIFVAVVAAAVVPVLDILQAPASAAPAPDHGMETEATPIVHSSDAILVAVEGLGALTVGLGLVVPRPLTSERGFALVGGLSLLYADGLIHWFAILEHLAEPPSAAFFAIAGAAQVFAIPVALRGRRVLWWVGVALPVFFLELFLVTRFVPAPFALSPEPVEALGLLSKAAELGLLAAMAGYLGADILPSSLRHPLMSRPIAFVLLAGAVVTDGIVGAETVWGLLPATNFVLTLIVLIVFVLAVTASHRRPSTGMASLVWIGASMLLLGHVLYAWYYEARAFQTPTALCAIGAGVLGAAGLALLTARLPPRPSRAVADLRPT